MQPTAQIWILATNRSEAVRKAADSADPDTCHKLFGGCGQAADAMALAACQF
jgi:hypothetical protein